MTLEGRGELMPAAVHDGLRRGGLVAEAALLAGGHMLRADEVIAMLADAEAGSRAYLYALAAFRHRNDQEQALPAVQDALLAHIEDANVVAFALAAARGRELALIRALVESGAWSRAQEQHTGMLGRLAQQQFRADGAGAAVLLDYLARLEGADLWVQQAVLDGLYETTREPGFVRAELNGPHALFDAADDALWPAVAKARRGFTWPGDTLAADAKLLTPRQAELMAQGERFYASSCANCHGADGAGVGALGPPLADSPWVTQAPERLARIVLHGLRGPVEVAGATWDSAMPGHKDFPGFDDAVASGLLTYLRRVWGHAGRAIDPEFVTDIREQTAARTALWTVAELENIDINTHFAKYAGGYGRPAAPLLFAYDGRDLIIDASIFGGPLKELKEDHFLFEPRQIRVEFVVADDGTVLGVTMSEGAGVGRMIPRLSDG